MKVSIIKDWNDPDIFRQTPGNSGVWDNVQFINGNSMFADIVVVLNVPPKNIFGFFREGGSWLMSQEPPHDFYRWQTESFKDFDKVFTFWDKDEFPRANIVHLQTCLPWHVEKSYDELVKLKVDDISVKRNEVSWITSSLNTRPGHTIRLEFLEFLKNQGFEFSLFGRGFQPIKDKFEGIAPFKYSIAIENFSCNDYWTEKIADCFLSWTMPIYFGCKNITDYFPKDSIISIDPRKPGEALEIIKKAMSDNAWEKNLRQIQVARELILNEYQFFPAVAKRIKECQLGNRRLHFINKPKFK